jgi:hypothetical protein
VNSANFNQQIYQYSTLLTIMDTEGVLGWTNLAEYPIGGYAKGSDNLLYYAAIANGPSSSIVDPVGDVSGTWIWFSSGQDALDELAVQTPGSEGTRLIGHTNETLYDFLSGIGFPVVSGWFDANGVIITGSVGLASGSRMTSGTTVFLRIVFTTPFPNVNYRCVIQGMGTYGSTPDTIRAPIILTQATTHVDFTGSYINDVLIPNTIQDDGVLHILVYPSLA